MKRIEHWSLQTWKSTPTAGARLDVLRKVEFEGRLAPALDSLGRQGDATQDLGSGLAAHPVQAEQPSLCRPTPRASRHLWATLFDTPHQ